MAYLDTNGAGTSCIVDFAKTASIGSSALYMLLLLYDYAGGGATDITISNASRIVKSIKCR
jgi:anti-anti-sigma regulatory factor